MRLPSRFLMLAVLPALAAPPLIAQQTSDTVRVAARADDVSSEEAIVRALYDVISGPAGPRDWDRFRSLFVPDARLIPAGRRPDSTYRVRVLTVDQYVASAGNYFQQEGFYERELAHRGEAFGQIVHRFSTYESRHAPTDMAPFARGINSIQLFNDGTRWWVVTIMWDAERPGLLIPDRYLRSE
jgi:hypothetical protein